MKAWSEALEDVFSVCGTGVFVLEKWSRVGMIEGTQERCEFLKDDLAVHSVLAGHEWNMLSTSQR